MEFLKKNKYILLLIILSAFMRLNHISSTPPGLWYDETRNLGYIEQIMKYHNFSMKIFLGEPLYAFFGIAGCLIAGIIPTGLRLGSAIAGILTIPAAYWAIKIVWGRKNALVSSFILAVLPWHIIFSRIGFRGITMPLFFCISLALFELAIRKRNKWAMPALAVSLGMSYYTYIPIKMIYPLLIIYGIFIINEQKRWKWLFDKQIILKQFIPSIIIMLLMIIPSLLNIGKFSQPAYDRINGETNLSNDYVFSKEGPVNNAFKSIAMFVYKGDENPRHNTPGAAQIPRMLFPFLVAGIFISLLKLKSSKNILLLCSFVFFLLPTILSLNAPHALRAIGAIIPVCVFISRGIRYLLIILKKHSYFFRNAFLSVFIYSVIFTALFTISYYQYFHVYAKSIEVWQEFQTVYTDAAEEIGKLPEDAVVLHEEMFYGRLTFEFLTRERKSKIKTVKTAREMVDFVPQNSPCYILFIGREKFGKEFKHAYPEAPIVKKFYTPDNRIVGVMFRIK